MIKMLSSILLSSVIMVSTVSAEERCYGVFRKKCYEIDRSRPHECNNPRYCNEKEFAQLEKIGIEKKVPEDDYTIYIYIKQRPETVMTLEEIKRLPEIYIGSITVTKDRNLVFSDDFDEETKEKYPISNILRTMENDEITEIPFGVESKDGSIGHGYAYAHKNSDYFVNAIENNLLSRYILKYD